MRWGWLAFALLLAFTLPEFLEDSRRHIFPGGVRLGQDGHGIHFVQLDDAPLGAIAWCDDCLPTNPGTQGVLGIDGAFCFRERPIGGGSPEWDCGGCGACIPNGQACINNSDCCSASCIGGVCSAPLDFCTQVNACPCTTSTTTSTTTTTT